MPDNPSLSVIITSCTTERLNDIYELLDSIKAQTYPSIETLFVAERSRELLDKVNSYAGEKNILNLKVLFNDGEPGLSARVKLKAGKQIIYNPNVKVRHRVYNRRVRQKFIMQRAYSVGYQRRMLKKPYPEPENDLLNQEHQLLKRIFTRLFPSILKTLFTNPVVAWRKFQVTVTALIFVTLGYYFHLLPNHFTTQKEAE